MDVSETQTGVFRAVATRDAAAVARHGCAFVEAHLLKSRIPDPDGDLWEIQFPDGHWMLASTPDLAFEQ